MSKPRNKPPAASPVDPRPLRLLVVEDSAADAELIQHELTKAGFEVTAHRAQTAAEVTERLRAESYDLVLADYGLPGWTGLDVLALVRQEGHDAPLILVTGTLGDELAVDSVKHGAADYVLKDRLGRLPMAVTRALEDRAIQQARTRAEQVLRATDAVMYVLDAARQPFLPLWISENVTRVFGYSVNEVLSPTWWVDHLHPEDRDRILGAQPRLDEWETFRHEYRFRHRDGTYRWLQDELRMTRDATGRPKELLGVMVDVTERRWAEEELQLFRALIDRSNDAIEVVDPQTARFLDVNDKACLDLGYSRDELLSLSVFDIDPTVSQAAFPQLMREIERAASCGRESTAARTVPHSPWKSTSSGSSSRKLTSLRWCATSRNVDGPRRSCGPVRDGSAR